jgi:hypothetical protein
MNCGFGQIFQSRISVLFVAFVDLCCGAAHAGCKLCFRNSFYFISNSCLVTELDAMQRAWGSGNS